MVSIQLSDLWMHHKPFWSTTIWHWTNSFNGTYKKSSPLTLEFLYMGKCKRSSSIVEKKGRSWACRQVSDVHLWCFWFLFKYWYRMQQRFFLGKKRGLRLAIHESSSFWKRVIEIYRVTCWVLEEISTQKCKLKF